MVQNQYDPVLIHEELLGKIREFGLSEQCSDRILLMSVFQNYRTGAGLRLSKFGFDMCKEYTLYEFVECEFSNELNSIFLMSMDRVSSGPYYIENNKIFLSDRYLAALAIVYEKNFFDVFDVFS